MYKLYGWHYYILLLSAIIFVLLCYDFLAWMGSRILTKKMFLCATVSTVRRTKALRYYEYGKLFFGNTSFSLNLDSSYAEGCIRS